ncbi:hypothetical protein NHX12_028971 [Muraenolepis orangiensis]|uniref:Uncharacterized protein n=1 Tax=Muraenolepis orangiensis TaxID=630683 RepID=A0A9Q0EBJ8_9TELE|nr:hypothetical protein NHX12_028971 [Muraenolepis orangiensis]
MREKSRVLGSQLAFGAPTAAKTGDYGPRDDGFVAQRIPPSATKRFIILSSILRSIGMSRTGSGLPLQDGAPWAENIPAPDKPASHRMVIVVEQ